MFRLQQANSYVERVGKYPQAAGAALYTQKAFQVPFLTFIIAFMVMCSGLSSASAAARAFSGDYLAEFTDVLPSTLVAILFIHLRGVPEAVKTNVVLTLVELTGLLVILTIGAWAVLTGDGEPGRLGEFQAEGTGSALITSVLGATALEPSASSPSPAARTPSPWPRRPRIQPAAPYWRSSRPAASTSRPSCSR